MREPTTKLPGTFVKAPNELLTRPNLSDAALHLWLIISAFAWSGEGFPNIQTLAYHMGRSRGRIFELLTEMEQRGYLERSKGNRNSNCYRLLIPSQEVQDSGPVQDSRLVQNVEQSSPGFRTPVVQDSGLENDNLEESAFSGSAPEADTSNEPDRKVISEQMFLTDVINRERAHPADAPTETTNRASKKRQKEAARQKAESAMQSLNLAKFREEYPALNVDSEHIDFMNHHLARPANYYGSKRRDDWNLAFHTWCRNAPKWNPNGSKPSPPGTGPKNICPEYQEWSPND